MIKVSHLTKQYGPRTAISDLNFEIPDGEIVGLLGPNGAGKSTTMKILSGFMPATSGEATVAGYDIYDETLEVKRQVGYLPENPPVYLDMPVRDYVTFAANLNKVDSQKIKISVDSALERTGLTNVSKRLIGNLSKGYRQRVGIAQAIVHSPKVLILDEPTVGLDPAQIIEIRELIRSFGGEHTVILSSHILSEITATCNRIIMISQGKVAADNSLAGLIGKYNSNPTYNLDVKQVSDSGIAAIRALKQVVSVETGSVNNRIVIQLTPDGDAQRDAVIAAAVQANMGVLEFTSSRVNLEDVFLRLTAGTK